MEGAGEGPDTSSIQSTSSLRSRFESMAKEKSKPQTPPVVPKKPQLSASTGNRPENSGDGQTSQDRTLPPPISRTGRPTLPKQRPQSMIFNSPPKLSPPVLTVDHPASPPKNYSLDLRRSPSRPLSSTFGTESPQFHARTLSRITTPALEARVAGFTQSPTGLTTDSDFTRPPVPFPTKPSSQNGSVPPPINRAAKPQIPTKPNSLAQKSTNLAAPDIYADVSDRSVSPFTTPPSSGKSSPDKPGPPLPSRNRNDSDASFVERLRSDSDLSVAGRPRDDSVSSLPGYRTRGGVESSSFSERQFRAPPTHHTIAARKDQRTYPPPNVNENFDMTCVPALQSREVGLVGDLPEHRPRLPARPELQTRRISPPRTQSGRPSPTRARQIPAQRSVDGLTRAATTATINSSTRSVQPAGRSALTQGFGPATRTSTEVNAMANSSSKPQTPTLAAPTVPPPRRSMEKRRPEPPQPPTAVNPSNARAVAEEPVRSATPAATQADAYRSSPSDYPDSSSANRRPPLYSKRPHQIPIGYDTKLTAVCGEYVCTTGFLTKVWNVRNGEQILNMAHDENVRSTSLVFKPSSNPADDGKRLWLGLNSGEIQEIDIPSRSIVKSRPHVHNRREVVRMFRHASELWTLDDGGDLNVWKSDQKGMPSLDSKFNSFRVSKSVSFAVQCGPYLWLANGREIRVYRPSARSEPEFLVSKQPLGQPGTGEVTCGTTLSSRPDIVYFGHSDGKVSIYNRSDYSCVGVVNASVYKIIAMAGVGEDLWLGFSTGMIYIMESKTVPWRVKKAWQAHDKQVCSIAADLSAMWKMDRLQVITLGTDNMLRIWDGLLQEDWLESRMLQHDTEYCTFNDMTAAVLTWNAGASKPHYLQHSVDDSGFFQEYMRSFNPVPDVFVFGFQELVDLEDKAQTAKSFFKSKKKDTNELEHMTHQYRAWRDHLTKCLDDYMPVDQTYNLLHSASMVGLFTCVFVKSTLRNRIRHVHATEVKRGMGGRHGNKGALVMRMVLDDSSICLLNCHLAAGQTQTLHRNNDIAAILENNSLPAYPLNQNSIARHNDVFASGGDGSMVLDHEICVLNGDLNYRIDTMGRDTVVKAVESNSLGRLLERDQLLLSKKKNPGFRLRAFHENSIGFAPTYKYNPRTDVYDTSEKRRAPAWCDRILYRGLGKVKLEDYRRWELRVSDHRPVSGHVRMRVKTVDAERRGRVWETCCQEFAGQRGQLAKAVQLDYLTNVLGLSASEAEAALAK